MSKRTSLYEEHLKLGAKIVDFAGWEMPVQYAGVTEEHLAVRNAAGIFDVSHMGLFEVTGDSAEASLNYITTNDVTKLSDYHAQYSLLLNEKGTVVDDIIVYKIDGKRFLIVVNASNLEKDFKWINFHLKSGTSLKDLSPEYSLIAIQGPKAMEIMNRISAKPLNDVLPFHLAVCNFKNVGETIIAKTGYTGEEGCEIFVKNEHAPLLWKTLFEAGGSLGLKAVGLAARDTLRLEMKYSLYGHEINDEINPLEADLKWVVKLKKGDFIGRVALVKIDAEGLKRRLIGFKMIDKAIPREGYPIVDAGKKIGYVTSGTFSPSLKYPIGIGYVDLKHCEIGSKFSVDIRGRERLAEVVRTPFYKKV